MNKIKYITVMAIGLILLCGGQMKVFSDGPKKVKIFNVSTGQVVELDKVYKTDAQWKKILTPEQ